MKHIRSAPKGTTPVAASDRFSWQAQGSCADESVELFFDGDTAEAKEVCASCPETIRRTCLDYALTQPENYGIWGGFTEDERATERRRRQRGSIARYTPEKKPRPAPRPAPEPVDPWESPIGSTRRLQALFADGHRADRVVAETGLTKPTLVNLRHGHTSKVRSSTARLIRVAYERLVTKSPGEGAAKCRREAAGRGWEPSSAWAGVDMDDPAARARETATAA